MSIQVSNLVWDVAPTKDMRDLVVLLALADWSRDDGVSWHSIANIAARARCSPRTVQYVVKKLSTPVHGIALLTVRKGKGTHGTNFYALNIPHLRRLRLEQAGQQKLPLEPEAQQAVPETPPAVRPAVPRHRQAAKAKPAPQPVQKAVAGVQNRPSRGATALAGGGCNSYCTRTVINRKDQNQNHHACGAMSAWLDVKHALRKTLPAKEWSLWVRPMYLLRNMGGQMLLALPPSGKIVEAVRANKGLLLEAIRARGYSGFSLTRYPDDFERRRLATEYPEFYAGMYGTKKQPQAVRQVQQVQHSQARRQ